MLRNILSGLLLVSLTLTPLVNVTAQEAEPSVAPEQTENSKRDIPTSDEKISDNNSDTSSKTPSDNLENDKNTQTRQYQEKTNIQTKSIVKTEKQATRPQFRIPSQPEANVDESTGALNYEYPIELPKGRAEMTPDLSLMYDSRDMSKPDSIVGLGWKLSIPYIQREPLEGTQNLYNKAYFSSSLSGNLIAATDTNLSQFTTYRSETDNGEYLKYVYNSDNSWTVKGKDGKTYRFGETAIARQDNPNNITQVYKWMISRISDTHGNEIQFTYTKDNGQIYPSAIIYTYHPAAPAVHRVDFTFYTPDNFGSTVYNSAFPITTNRLLQKITVTTTIDNNTSVLSYTLSHTDAQFLKLKNLQSIGRSLALPEVEFNQPFDNRTSFSYSTKTPGWEQGTYYLGDNLPFIDDSIYNDIHTADFDKNGFPDVLVSTQVNRTLHNHLVLNTGTTFVESSAAWSLPNVDLSDSHAIVDVNGDQLPDFHFRGFAPTEPHAMYLNTGQGFVADTSGIWEIGTYVPEASACGPNVGDHRAFDMNAYFYDINYDGKNDILYFGGSADFRVFLNTGNGFTRSFAYTFTAAPGANFTILPRCTGDLDADGYQTLIDLNGDGLEDFYHEQYGTYLNTGRGFAFNAAYDMDIDEMDRSGFADINGDNLLDYVGLKGYNGTSRCARVLFNTGSGFKLINPTSFPPCDYVDSWHPARLNYTSNHPESFGTLSDITADGYPDIIGAMPTNSVTGRVRAIDDAKAAWVENSFTSDPWKPIITPSYGKFLDINNDGVLDFITPNVTWDGEQMPQSKVYMGKPSVPNRLTQITTPLGAQTVITYGTAPTNYSDTDASPMPVVKKVSIQNVGHGQPNILSQYDYKNGVYISDAATGQKRFVGFHKITRTESGDDLLPLRITETYFHQANGSDAATSEPPDSNLALVGKPYYSVTRNSSDTQRKETRTKYGTDSLSTEPATGRASNFVHPTEMLVKTVELEAVVITAETYSYDVTLGERTELRNLGFVTLQPDGSFQGGSDSRYQVTEYAANSDWSIVLPKRVDLRTSPAGADTIERTDYVYDNQPPGSIGALGELTKETKLISRNGALSADTTYTYDEFGNRKTVTNPRNAGTNYTYDSSKSLVASETNPLGQTTSYEYLTGLLKKITDPNGRVTSYGYSSEGWLYRTTVANTGGNQRVRQFLDATGGNWAIESYIQLVNNREDQTWQSLDNLGRPVRLVRKLLNHTTGSSQGFYLKEAKSYDSLGREIKTAAPYGIPDLSNYSSLFSVAVPPELVTTNMYDVFDRPTAVTNALGATSFNYAGTETMKIDANGHKLKTEVDAYGNLVKVTEFNDTEEYVTTYRYDARNLLIGITDALGNIRSFNYNNAGWLVRSEDLHTPDDSLFGVTIFKHDLNGNVIVETQPNGTTISRSYDTLDRPLTLDGSTTPAVDFTYSYDTCTNGKGRLCQVSGNLPNQITLSKSFTYGISGVPTSMTLATLGSSYTTSYQYNFSDQISKTTYPNGTIVRTVYGDWALPGAVYVTLPGGSENVFATASYHHTEKTETVSLPSGLAINHTYDSANLYRETKMNAARGKNILVSYDYSYDRVNNITQIQELGLTKNYQYDNLNRLTQAVFTGLNAQPIVYHYSYNAIGNILSANGYAYSYDGYGKANPHAVTGVGSSFYIYDDNGNITNAPNKPYRCETFQSAQKFTLNNDSFLPSCDSLKMRNPNNEFYYNWQNQPDIILLGGLTPITSAYDENGNRFLYQPPNTVEIQAEDNYLLRNGAAEITITLNEVSIGLISNNAIYSTIIDHLGTPVKQVNSSGIIVEDTSYDSFGIILSHTGTIDIKKGFTGHEYDVDTGLNYMQARYYNPSIGRFLSQDNVYLALGDQNKVKELTQLDQNEVLADPQSLNSYSYAKNNPLAYIDPSGNFSLKEKWEEAKQKYNNGVVWVGNKAEQAYQNNSVARYALDHPYQAGAAIGVVGGGLVAGGVVVGGGTITCGIVCGGGAIVAGGSAVPVAQQVQKNQQQILAAGNRTLQYTQHALAQMLERGITQLQVATSVQKGQTFDYIHKGVSKIGYYDPVSKVLVATVKSTGNITTVINNVSQRYVNGLIQTVKK